jgi:hypothetical protein
VSPAALTSGSNKRPEATGVNRHVAMRPGKSQALKKNSPWESLLDKAEQLKASVRAKIEHPFRVIQCQFGFTKVRYKGLSKNTVQLMKLFALGNLWMARRHLLNAWGWRLHSGQVSPRGVGANNPTSKHYASDSFPAATAISRSQRFLICPLRP